MRRVVITGIGIVSPLGNDAATVSRALREGRSGLRAAPGHASHGLRSQVAGACEIDLEAADRPQAQALHG
jgi:3-oxoacyl-[acyl-carrier-protein] synthase-1